MWTMLPRGLPQLCARWTPPLLALLLVACTPASTGTAATEPAPDAAEPATPGATSALTSTPAPAAQDVRLPAADTVVDYQLGGAYPPPDGVGGVARDSTELPEPGLYSICYVNGFQTQPGESATWLAEHPELLLHDDGVPVVDPAWPDEYLLDTSTAEQRAAISVLVGEVITRCAWAGFDAVELDNLDSWTRSDGLLTMDDAVDLATSYVMQAHALGLAVAQKNAGDLGARGRDEAGFDLAVVEECHRWDECSLYTDVFGTVLDIEYADDLRGTFADVCADPESPASTILRDRDLTTPADLAYVFDSC